MNEIASFWTFDSLLVRVVVDGEDGAVAVIAYCPEYTDPGDGDMMLPISVLSLTAPQARALAGVLEHAAEHAEDDTLDALELQFGGAS